MDILQCRCVMKNPWPTLPIPSRHGRLYGFHWLRANGCRGLGSSDLLLGGDKWFWNEEYIGVYVNLYVRYKEIQNILHAHLPNFKKRSEIFRMIYPVVHHIYNDGTSIIFHGVTTSCQYTVVDLEHVTHPVTTSSTLKEWGDFLEIYRYCSILPFSKFICICSRSQEAGTFFVIVAAVHTVIIH